MPLPLIPLAIAGVGGLITGAVLSGDENDAQVIINPVTDKPLSLTNILLLSGATVAAAVIIPKVLAK